jgi:hypothetical protein
MKLVTIAAVLAALVAVSANAMNAELDTDGDGQASLSELQIMNPEITDDLFLELDTDVDGFLSDEEMTVAIEAGNLADPEADS